LLVVILLMMTLMQKLVLDLNKLKLILIIIQMKTKLQKKFTTNQKRIRYFY